MARLITALLLIAGFTFTTTNASASAQNDNINKATEVSNDGGTGSWEDE